MNRLTHLRELIASHNLGYYLVLSSDAHSSEYVCPSDKRREYISQFTGSAGTAIIGSDNYVELSTDGRYWLQANDQLGSSWILRKEGSGGVVPWNKAICARSKAEGVAVGVDSKLISYSEAQDMIALGTDLQAIEPNLVDIVWAEELDRKKSSSELAASGKQLLTLKEAKPVYELDVQYTGKHASEKLADLRGELSLAKANTIVLSALDEIAWVLNMRGSDIEFNPLFKAFLMVSQSETSLYISDHQLPQQYLQSIGVQIRSYDTVYDDVRNLASKGETVWVPPGSSWAMALAATPTAPATAKSTETNLNSSKPLLGRQSPVEAAKARKNEVEIEGARKSQVLCGSSVVELLSWLQQSLREGTQVDEFEASQKLLEFRRKLPNFKSPSFTSISSSGPNGAIIHYSPPDIGSRLLSLDEVYLLDSGSQFLFGTTDTTRTVWFNDNNPPPAEVVEAYTLVLKGNIALATALFPEGTTGDKLDPLARQFLWKRGLNYAHGTGHGVGSFLNVHEGPVNISLRYQSVLSEGNLVSNEPGYYKDGHFGIRIENMMVVERASPKYRNSTEFLKFNTITLAPFDRNLIDLALLSKEEVDWINLYHEECYDQLKPILSESAQDYLHYHTRPLS